MKKSIIKKIISITMVVTISMMTFTNVFAETSPNGQELSNMIEHYGNNYIDKNLDEKTQQLLIIATMTSLQAYSQIKEQTLTALDKGVKAVEIKETIYHAAPYCGYTKALSAIEAADEAFSERSITIPIESQATVTEENRYEKGLEVQRSIFGQEIGTITDDMTESQKVITEYLSSICFGDFYTRGTLDIKARELITLCVIAANGGCESQLGSHTTANISVGNNRDEMLAAMLLCVPYNGYPRTLNAINTINSTADTIENQNDN